MHGDDQRLPHDDRLATVIQTSFDTDLLTFEEACAFLEPAGWPDCNDFWCEMSLQPTPLADGRRWSRGRQPRLPEQAT